MSLQVLTNDMHSSRPADEVAFLISLFVDRNGYDVVHEL